MRAGLAGRLARVLPEYLHTGAWAISRRFGSSRPGGLDRLHTTYDHSQHEDNGRRYRNTNRLLGNYKGMDGIKTGYIRAAGYNLAASVRRDSSSMTVDGRVGLFQLAPFREHYNRNYAVHPDGQGFVMVGDTETRIVWRVNALADAE